MMVPVLLYHVLRPRPAAVHGMERSLFLSPERFGDQLDDLAKRGLHSLTLKEFAAGLDRGFRRRTVLITFDDAYDHIADVATPILRQHGFTAVMFASLGELGGHNRWDANWAPALADLEIMSADRLHSLDPAVWEVGCHVARHIDLRTLPSTDRRAGLIATREGLEAIVGRPVVDLAYPYGRNDAAVRRDAERAGYRMAFAAANGTTHRFDLPRWPISAEDSLEMFRLKTSVWSLMLYRAYEHTPAWVQRPLVTRSETSCAASAAFSGRRRSSWSTPGARIEPSSWPSGWVHMSYDASGRATDLKRTSGLGQQRNLGFSASTRTRR
jgi:peptidoglycan/xylan/chitin deacetylase (PgdA/CDA1 family)